MEQEDKTIKWDYAELRCVRVYKVVCVLSEGFQEKTGHFDRLAAVNPLGAAVKTVATIGSKIRAEVGSSHSELTEAGVLGWKSKTQCVKRLLNNLDSFSERLTGRVVFPNRIHKAFLHRCHTDNTNEVPVKVLFYLQTQSQPALSNIPQLNQTDLVA